MLNPRACQPGAISITAGLALMPLESLPPNGRTAPSRHRRISLKVTLPSTICDGPVMMQSASGRVSSHQRMIPRDPVVLADHVAGIRDRRPVLDDRSAQVRAAGTSREGGSRTAH